MALERKECRIINEIEYHFRSLDWAERYLGRDVDTIIRERRSLAGACRKKLNKNAWTVRVENYLKEQQTVNKMKKHGTPNDCPVKRPMTSASHLEASKKEYGNEILDEGES